MTSDAESIRKEAARAEAAAKACQEAIDAYGRDLFTAKAELLDALAECSRIAAHAALKAGVSASVPVTNVDRLVQMHLHALERSRPKPDPMDQMVRKALAPMLTRVQERSDV